MESRFKKIAIVGKYMRKSTLPMMQADLLNLASHLQEKSIDVVFEAETAEHADLKGFSTIALADVANHADMVVVMGGDGTMLSVARAIKSSSIPFVGINRGRFGFLTDLRAEDMLSAIDEILAGRYQSESRMMLTGDVIRGKDTILTDCALNDIVLKSGLRLIELEVKINDNFVYCQRADGLIITTPTGTTAYSLSSGGPILHPDLEAIALVPICPHTLSNRPLAVNGSADIEVTLKHVDDAQISFDGQFQLALEAGDTIKVAQAKDSVNLLHPADYCYYEMLRNKLHWG